MKLRVSSKRFCLLVLFILYIGLHISDIRFGCQITTVSNHLKITGNLSSVDHTSQPATRRIFSILFWSTWHSHDPAKFLRVPDCDDEFEILSNISDIGRADAIVFDYARLYHISDYLLNNTHNPNVSLILSNQETEHHTSPLNPKQYDGIFNFIWMFRRDADIHHEFKEMYQKYPDPDQRWIYGSEFSHDFLRNKTKLAAWVVGNCELQPSHRNQFIGELAKHGVFVDVYGKCGNDSCEGDFKDGNCFPRIGREYKFYMALENSLCLDYITEKPAHGWENNMIPIIYGIGQKEMAAPPNSYIDALQFDTTEELAKRIKFLDENPEEYFKYFHWKSVYNTSSSYHSSFHCYAWRKIRELTEGLRRNVIVNSTYSVGLKRLEYWRAYFYNTRLKLYCKNCVETGVNVTHPKQNIVKLYNDATTCVKTIV